MREKLEQIISYLDQAVEQELKMRARVQEIGISGSYLGIISK